MFIVPKAPVPYSDPWLLPLTERMQRASRGKHRVAYLYETLDSGTFRYRVYNMIQALEARPEISATYFLSDEIDGLSRVLEHIDTLVLGRYRYTPALNRLITRARSYGKTILFDIDDIVYDVDYVQLVAATLDQELEQAAPGVLDHWFAHFSRLGAALKLCDAAITTNDYLARRIHEYTRRPVMVIPNFMNREQLALSQQIYEQKCQSGFARDGRIHIGYFSGTPTHNRDLELAADAIAHLLHQDPRVVLRVVGFMKLKGPLRELGARIERFEFQDFVNLQRLVDEVELNLMPLQDNEFTNCKSELKYFEAGIVGTVSIASPVFTYRHGITDGVTGFLAMAHQWEDKLAAALRQLGDYRAMAEKAHADCEQRYTYYHYTDLIAQTLFSSRLTCTGQAASLL